MSEAKAEIIAGYDGVIDIPYTYVDCEQSESLSHTDIDECIGANLDECLWGLHPDRWPKVVEVELYVRNEVTEKAVNRFADRALETLQEELDEDEEYGHPEERVELGDPEAAKEAMRQAVRVIMRERDIWYCRSVKTFEVDVRAWVSANEPTWNRETGSKPPHD